MRSIPRIFVFALAVIAILAFGTTNAPAYTLDLLGVFWYTSVDPKITYSIRASKAISEEAVDDVLTAIEQWNAALSSVPGAATLVPAPDPGRGRVKADIVIHMKRGGGAILGMTITKTESPFSCFLERVSVLLSGKAFGEPFSSVGTQNVARHELGHALGLGHSDCPEDLMYWGADSEEIFGDEEVLISDCDIRGIETIYSSPQCPIGGPVYCGDLMTCP